jgi:aldose 1-epimerase
MHTEIDSGYLVLEHEDTQLILDPARGGGVREFSWRNRPVFRTTHPTAGADPLDLACFPLVPYANRIADGLFRFDGRSVQLQRNWDGDPHPLHGQGWRSPWTVAAASAQAATLAFEGGGDEWPWRYRSEQHFELRPAQLTVTLSIENLGESPMPAMLGLHPYFSDPGNARFLAHVSRVWSADREALAVEEMETPIEWSFDRPRLIGAVPLDHCFAEWNGAAVLTWPDCKLDIRATNCPYLHVYAPLQRDFFCVEPQSAAAGALNRGRNEVTVVQPGGRFEIQVNFAVGVP